MLRWLFRSPPMCQIALRGAVLRLWTTMLRLELFSTLVAFIHSNNIACSGKQGNKIIEIERKYCEIAEDRLRQEVLDL